MAPPFSPSFIFTLPFGITGSSSGGGGGGGARLELDGQELDTVRVALNGSALSLNAPDG